MSKVKKYYVYLHLKSDTGEPFYVGKGSGTRASRIYSRSTFWENIVDKHGFDIIILEEGLSEEESFDLEKYWIKRIGRRDLGLGPLVNLTDGGDGRKNFKHTDEFKAMMSKTHKGVKRTPEHIQKMKDNHVGFSGKKHTEETKKVIARKSRINNYKKVIDTLTGEVYISVIEASEKTGINYSTLRSWLNPNNKNKNKSNLRYE